MFDTEHFDSEATDVLTQIGEVYADEFDAPVTILTASLGEGMIVGQLMSGGDIYNYAADGNEIGFDYSPEDSEEINEYARGFLESGYGIKTDSMESPYEYAFGFVRLDAQVRCKKGGVACGKICLPKGAKCKKYGGAGNAGAMKQAAGKLKSPGGVVAGVGAGLVGAAALAGGAGYLAYKNRDKLGEPGRKLGVIGTRVKAAAREGKEEFMSGVNAAKQILKTSEGVNKGLENTPPVEGVSRKEGYKLNTAKKMAQAGSRGAGLAGAAGAVAAGTENAINAVKYNLTRNPKFGSGSGKGEIELDRQQMNATVENYPSNENSRSLPGSKVGQKLLNKGKDIVTPPGKDRKLLRGSAERKSSESAVPARTIVTPPPQSRTVQAKARAKRVANARAAEVEATASKSKRTSPATEEQRRKEEKRRRRAEINSQSAGYGEESWVEPVAKAIVATNEAAASKKGRGFGKK